jgi:RHH-type transcriptional regulator, proline utilization regulon repressor / proline dehydrogenase / delta 1-pyrroline-5-carboxylate dehydrogenase
MSKELDEALLILKSVRGKRLSLEERKHLSCQLAALILHEANSTMTSAERHMQRQLARLMEDPRGKAFTTAMTDQCFRSKSLRRIADQMIYLLQVYGLPRYLDRLKQMQLSIFRSLGAFVAQFLVPLATTQLRKETARVILPGEASALNRHLEERKKEGIRLNLNHLGEAILSEREALERLQVYLRDLEHPDIDYISVKISTIFSQIHLIDFDGTVAHIAERLRTLYRAAQRHEKPRFINLDMEEYRDLDLTVAAFQRVLDESEFHSYSAGIVLQAYLPDAHPMQCHLTEWAKKRVKHGGAPIKIRIVKGANLAMEQFEASLKGWPQAPYPSKVQVDANYKRMVLYGCEPENAHAVRLGIASHNLFDLAFALLLRQERCVDKAVEFEMLEGMAEPIRRVVQKLSGDMLLYCPIATKEEFQHAIAYLVRRLDENTGPENFLRHLFELKPGSEAWKNQTALFEQSCDRIATNSTQPRRIQNRMLRPFVPDPTAPFDNEPDTDFSLSQNRRFAADLIQKWKETKPKPIPLVIAGKEIYANEEGRGTNPSAPHHPYFVFAKAHREHIERALTCAKAHEQEWASTTVSHRSHLLTKAAQIFRERRGEFIGVMMMDGGKCINESDPEVSEAIDFAEYYRHMMEQMAHMEDLQWSPKGTVVVASPWNFPCAIPAGGMLAALVTGNCVLFKPSSDAVLVAWHVVNAIWDAGVPKEILQFVPCSGEGAGSQLITDPRVNCVILTGGTSTAQKFLQMRPGLDLAAETGGKNAMIITALADRDLAIKDLIHSAFSHNGQKCSAASLAVLEAEVYDDPHFLRHLKEAVVSLNIGPATDPSVRITPLIHPPRGALLRGLSTLDEGESWLLAPKQDAHNPHLWSPGIKLGVRPGSFTHMTELFGPVLGVMRAESLEQAIDFVNATPYGLTSGLHSLDEREQKLWLQRIEAGNCYINRTTTGAIVQRQPFGGTKMSSFGNGSKAGGPNYLREFMHAKQRAIPKGKGSMNEAVNRLTMFLDQVDLTTEELGIWLASIEHYAYWWKRMSQDVDVSKIVGQDNFFRYVPRKNVCLRVTSNAKPLDLLRSCAAALTVGCPLQLSCPRGSPYVTLGDLLAIVEETEEQMLTRSIQRIRICEPLHLPTAIHVIHAPVLANGRIELLHYLREVSISIDYHRYGNLGLREGELRKPIT